MGTYRATLPTDLARRLREHRHRLELTYTEAAEQVGISRGYLANLEAGDRCPSVAVAELLADRLELDADLANALMAVARPQSGRSWRRPDIHAAHTASALADAP